MKPTSKKRIKQSRSTSINVKSKPTTQHKQKGVIPVIQILSLKNLEQHNHITKSNIMDTSMLKIAKQEKINKKIDQR